MCHGSAYTLNDWLSYFETLHPVGIDMGLQRVASVWQQLCRTHHINKIARQKVISVAGTNGKGSACQMLSLLLAGQGYQVGMYTSPHIHRFSERVRINGSEVDDSLLIQAFAAIEQARGDITLSYFEATTLAGLLVFAWQKVDFAVLEVGLGGRLDAVNIIDADAALITSIALDHEVFLGADVARIAVEKAGICRPNQPAVYAQTKVYQPLLDYCRAQHIPLLVNGRDYYLNNNAIILPDSTRLPLPSSIIALGEHQISNCAGVMVLLTQLALLPDNYQTLLQDFAVVGRLQTIATNPEIVIDVAHNEAAARALASYLQHTPCQGKTYAVIGMLADKAHRQVLLAVAGLFDGVFCGSTWGERGFSDQALATIATTVLDCPVTACGQLTDALQQAKKQAAVSDRIIAFGSFLVVEALY